MKPTELATMLRAWAAGYLPEMAAVELLVAHRHWLRRDAFLSAVTVSAVQGMASIDWDVIGHRLDAGEGLHDTSSERGVLAIACSLAAGRPVDLRDALLSLDSTNVRLIAHAVLTAGGDS